MDMLADAMENLESAWLELDEVLAEEHLSQLARDRIDEVSRNLRSIANGLQDERGCRRTARSVNQLDA